MPKPNCTSLAAEKMRLKALQRIEPREVEGQSLRQKQETDLEHVDRHAGQAEQPEDRQQIAAQRPERRVPMADDGLGVDREPGLTAQLLRQ